MISGTFPSNETGAGRYASLIGGGENSVVRAASIRDLEEALRQKDDQLREMDAHIRELEERLRRQGQIIRERGEHLSSLERRSGLNSASVSG